MKKIFNNLPLYLVTAFILYLPNLANAESFDLKTGSNSIHVGDSFMVTAGINLKSNAINTISGKIIIPTDYFSISDLRYGNSIISLWVDKPAINYSTGEIIFSGGIPGGFNSGSGPILSFGLKAKKTGHVVIKTDDISVLLNDGQGTPLTSILNPVLNLNILPAVPVSKNSDPVKTQTNVYTPPVDNIRPEHFIPLVSRYPTISNNQYFVSFSTVDKDSGVARYEVKETPEFLPFGETRWAPAVSPYVLQYQYWMTKVTVRAYDQQGNFIDSETYKPIDSMLAVFIALGVILVIYIIRKLSTKAPIKKKKKML